MIKKNKRHFNTFIGIIWAISGIINVITAIFYFMADKPLAYLYVCLALTCTFLSIFYISLGIKQKNKI